jgi:hypothetical protein
MLLGKNLNVSKFSKIKVSFPLEAINGDVQFGNFSGQLVDNGLVHAIVTVSGSYAGRCIGAYTFGRPVNCVRIIGKGIDLDSIFETRFSRDIPR